MSIHIHNLHKWFNQFHVLQDINLTIQTGELIALLGPSGCGKTSLLRIIAGLESPNSGQIYLNEQEISQQKTLDRHVGYVFQHYALFPHMTVAENISFGLRIRPRKTRPSPKEIEEKTLYLLDMVQLDAFKHRYPHELSGGQRQRVALARTLATNPDILLLDEPFSALDTKVRRELKKWFSKFHRDIQLTTIFVTHDQEEAMEIADRVVIMNKGIIEQIGTPQEILQNPINEFVYNFLGESNLITINKKQFNFRPYEIHVCIHEAPAGYFQAKVLDIRPLGGIVKLTLQPVQGGHTIEAQIPNTTLGIQTLAKGNSVYFKPILDFVI